jgi:hypothetical protein
MILPFNPCTITKAGQTDVYGQPTMGSSYSELCCVVRGKQTSAHSTVRADSSASRAYADERQNDVRFLLRTTTRAVVGDRFECEGMAVKIISLHKRFDVWGRLDHFEIEGETWV